jgi:brefeldin A-inhibited guanine nucleotide-exchange protein
VGKPSATSPSNAAELPDDQSSISTTGANANNMDSDAALTAAKAALKAEKPSATRDLKQDFQQIIIKSVFHLMFIQTITDILQTSNPLPVFNFIKSQHIARIMDCMEKSYYFARKFNADMDLRLALYRIGFMKQLPNLLRQETTAVSSLLTNILRLVSDANGRIAEMPKGIQAPFDTPEDRRQNVKQFEQTVSRISSEVLTHYCSLEPAVKQRNMSAWNSVIIRILKGLGEMDDAKFSAQLRRLYRSIIDIVQSHEMDAELRKAVSVILLRVDDLWKISE